MAAPRSSRTYQASQRDQEASHCHRRGTKTAKILALLGRSAGASLNELKKATGRQGHSVRGFVSGTLKKKMGLRIESISLKDGGRVYRLIAK